MRKKDGKGVFQSSGNLSIIGGLSAALRGIYNENSRLFIKWSLGEASGYTESFYIIFFHPNRSKKQR